MQAPPPSPSPTQFPVLWTLCQESKETGLELVSCSPPGFTISVSPLHLFSRDGQLLYRGPHRAELEKTPQPTACSALGCVFSRWVLSAVYINCADMLLTRIEHKSYHCLFLFLKYTVFLGLFFTFLLLIETEQLLYFSLYTSTRKMIAQRQ